MRRLSIVAFFLAATLLVLPAAPLFAVSLPHPPRPSRLTVSGFVVGRVAKGNLIRFGIRAFDPQTRVHLHSVKVVLILRGQNLQDMTFLIDEETFQMGDRPPVAITSATPLAAGFLRVNPRAVRRIRDAYGVRVTFWARVREPIPRGTTFRVIARDDDGNISYAREKVDISGGFLTWGTFAIGFVLALLIGVFVTNVRLGKRLREREPSIWDILERRLKEERLRPPVLVGARGDGGVG